MGDLGAFCGATNSAVKALALELATSHVNAVALVVVRSPLWERLVSSESGEAFTQLARQLPTGRVGEPTDGGFIYLMEQQYATGSVSLIDDGTLVMG
jgi:NAD(P)-dependent dehydrogenase (short-subunit alcohol dehydrogenase family)